jgi:hypothetical protein
VETEKKKKRQLSNDQLFLVCCIIGVVLFSWLGSSACYNLMDQMILVFFASGLIGMAFLFRFYTNRVKP